MLEIDPVTIQGAVIKKVTGHNAKFIIDHQIGPGATILVIRSGDVIPQIHTVITTGNIIYPDESYLFNSPDFYLIDESDEVKLKKINFFIKTLNIKYVGPATIDKIYKAGYNTINKITHLSISEIVALDRIGPTLGQKIYTNIQGGIKKVELAILMTASGLFPPGIGIKKLNAIIGIYPDILEREITMEDLIQVNGISTSSAQKVMDGLPYVKEWIITNHNITYEISTEPRPKSPIVPTEVIVFSGFRDPILEQQLIKQGHQVKTFISNNVTLLVVKDDTESLKVKNAKRLGIKKIYLRDLLKNYSEIK